MPPPPRALVESRPGRTARPLAAGLLALAVAPRVASAQPSPTPPAAPAAPEESAGEATVVGPARREQSLLDTPRAVSVDSSAAARRALARDVGERLDELPGVFVQRTTS